MIRYNPTPLRIFFEHVITRKVVLKIRLFFFGVIFEMGYVLYDFKDIFKERVSRTEDG